MRLALPVWNVWRYDRQRREWEPVAQVRAVNDQHAIGQCRLRGIEGVLRAEIRAERGAA